MENAQLYEDARRRTAELITLSQASQAIASTLDVEAVLALIVDEVKALLKTESVSVLLYNPGAKELIFAAVSGPEAEKLLGLRMPATATEGIAGWALRHGQATPVNNVKADPRHYKAVDAVLGLTTESLLTVPLQTRDRNIGVIEAIRRSGRAFTEHEMEMVKILAGPVTMALENARLYEAEREQRKTLERSSVQLINNQRLAATGQLAASLAHEINNPLQAIHNSLEIMLSFSLTPEEQQHYLQMAEEEIERLTKMVSRILDFSCRPQQEMQPLDINHVVQKVLNLARKFLEHRHIVLQTSLAPEILTVQGNATSLGQVILNLLINAVEAMPEGGTLEVTSSRDQNDHVLIEVSDTGRGISPETLEHIFEPFFSTKKGGIGLGLSISLGIVHRHNGDIIVESTPGEGTTFTLYLPARHQD
ncbi:MAG: ATP-binding protein [Anaerolineae bacterium]